jgi:predicted DNA-binding protein YlxM (UPF0122 family)
MLTGILIFIILGLVFWHVSKFLRNLSRAMSEHNQNESYFRSAVIDNLRGINGGLNPAPERLDLYAEINKVNEELRSKKEQHLQDQKAIDDLISGTDNIT